MCGIVGITSKKEFSSKEALGLLKRLEYRGYDSFGIATNTGKVEKFVGNIDENKINGTKTNTAIFHTRWSTHGGVTEENAHPHTDCNDEIFIVHNGIIDNYLELKNELAGRGHAFRSQTDSEVISHFFEEELKATDMKAAVEKFFRLVKGEFAVLLTRKDDDNLYAFKRGSPLVLGVADGMNILASDIYAFADKTNKAVFFNEDEFAVVSDSSHKFYRYTDGGMTEQEKAVDVVDWRSGEEDKNSYEHYMIKEIMEEPSAARRLITSLKTEQKENVLQLKKMIESSKRVVFVASGTSYHATLLGVYFLNRAGIETHTIVASEFRNFTLLDDNTLVIAVSQSGETMDVIKALRGIKAEGVKIASIVNVPYSTVQRMSNLSINILAGQEICVAATKTFVNQLITLLFIAAAFGYKEDVNKIPDLLEGLLKEKHRIESIAKSIKDCKDIYVLGRGFSYPVAREIALKLKEISYVHAEGMMAGELKHGTLALIEKGTPVIALMPKSDEDIISNAKEVEARGANVIAFHENSEFNGIKINANHKGSFAILSAVAGQLLTYYIAKENGLPIDKPRNLAKCVSVK